MPSSVVKTYTYDPDAQVLNVVFTTGAVYVYHDVPLIEYEAMKNSFAIGIYSNTHIKGKYKFEKVG